MFKLERKGQKFVDLKFVRNHLLSVLTKIVNVKFLINYAQLHQLNKFGNHYN